MVLLSAKNFFIWRLKLLELSDAGLRNFGVDFTKQPLAIHKVDNLDEKRTASGGRAAQAITYRLHFCSPELLRNDRVRVCQTLQGSYSDIIKQVLKVHLKTTKTIEVQQTTDLKHVNVPEMHPFEAIDWMTESSEFSTKYRMTQTFFR